MRWPILQHRALGEGRAGFNLCFTNALNKNKRDHPGPQRQVGVSCFEGVFFIAFWVNQRNTIILGGQNKKDTPCISLQEKEKQNTSCRAFPVKCKKTHLPPHGMALSKVSSSFQGTKQFDDARGPLQSKFPFGCFFLSRSPFVNSKGNSKGNPRQILRAAP